VLQHGEGDPVGNGKAPPNNALFSRRNAALVEVTDSGRDADDNRSILFLAGSTSFGPKAVISHMFIPDLNAGGRDSEMSVQASPSRDAKNKRNGKLGCRAKRKIRSQQKLTYRLASRATNQPVQIRSACALDLLRFDVGY
jgi:hypothetical protein